jgi:transposase
MDPYRAVVQQWLEADQQAPRKQRHTAQRIHTRLVEEHQFRGGASTVRRFVAGLRPAPREAFIPLTAAWGQQAQVDWGQALVEIAGQLTVVHLFCLRLRASGVPFVWAAPTEKLEAFLEGHTRAFAWLGGVPAECVYDNPKTAVVRILAGPAREEHTTFSSLRAHYLFDSQFCRPAQGHEKGAVENLVGYVRRNALVPVPTLRSWAELNQHLLGWCERERTRAGARWTQDQAGLRALPSAAFVAAVGRLAVVNRLCLVTVDRSRYSVPGQYVGQTLRLALFSDLVEAWVGQERVALHQRAHERGQTVLALDHYLPILERKPRAAGHAAVVAQLPPVYAAVRDTLCRARPDGYRDFVAILLLHRDFPAAAVATALEQAQQRGTLQAAVVRQLLLNQSVPVGAPPVALPPTLAPVQLPLLDLAQYNTLLPGGRT